jgi:hypothetical protein
MTDKAQVALSILREGFAKVDNGQMALKEAGAWMYEQAVEFGIPHEAWTAAWRMWMPGNVHQIGTPMS